VLFKTPHVVVPVNELVPLAVKLVVLILFDVIKPVNALVPVTLKVFVVDDPDTDIEPDDKVPLLFILVEVKFPHVALPIFELVDVKFVVSILFAVTIPVNALVEGTLRVFVVKFPLFEIELDDNEPEFTKLLHVALPKLLVVEFKLYVFIEPEFKILVLFNAEQLVLPKLLEPDIKILPDEILPDVKLPEFDIFVLFNVVTVSVPFTLKLFVVIPANNAAVLSLVANPLFS
jgi:hypothetical protein